MELMACPIGILLRIFFSFVVAGRDIRRPETAARQGARAPTHKVSPESRASSLAATSGSSWSVEVALVAFCFKFPMERSWS